MKKFISVFVSFLICFPLSITVYAKQPQEPVSEVSESSDAPDISDFEMDEREIAEFLLTAEPIPVPTASRAYSTTPTERTGSYSYDVVSQKVEFEAFSLPASRTRSTGQSSQGYFPNGTIELPAGGGISTKGIVGADNRVRVKNTTVGPYCNTVRLLIKTASGGNYIGSGFMIGPNSVATSGHCVKSRAMGGWAKSITVIPALNGTSRPYGSATSTNLICGGNWSSSYNNQDDWGVIRINKNLGYQTGWLGLRWQSASYNNLFVYANGYPGDSGKSGYMYYGTGRVTSCSDRTLTGNWDITGGQSGGPTFSHYSGSGYCAVGVNRGGGSTYSDSLRIDEWIYKKFMSYRSLTA